jgi:hypothetical protein
MTLHQPAIDDGHDVVWAVFLQEVRTLEAGVALMGC